MKIYGPTVGTTLPKPSWIQANPKKGDYIKDKPTEMEVVRGYSAYQVAVMNGFKGTEVEWLASLVGPPGATATQKEIQEIVNNYLSENEEDLLDGVVRTVNHIPPDENGNVNVTINGIQPDENGDFKIPGVTEDEDGNLIFPGGGTGNGTVTSVNGNLPDENGNVEVPIPEIDTTLTKSGFAADAEMTGIAFHTVGAGLWDGVLSMAETLSNLIMESTGFAVVETDSQITIRESRANGTTSTIVVTMDESKYPSKITRDGREIPVEWSVSG